MLAQHNGSRRGTSRKKTQLNAADTREEPDVRRAQGRVRNESRVEVSRQQQQQHGWKSHPQSTAFRGWKQLANHQTNTLSSSVIFETCRFSMAGGLLHTPSLAFPPWVVRSWLRAAAQEFLPTHEPACRRATHRSSSNKVWRQSRMICVWWPTPLLLSPLKPTLS